MPNKFYRILALFMMIIVGGFCIGYLKTFMSLRNDNSGLNIPGKVENHNVSSIEEMKLNPDAKIIYITYYTGCGHEIREEKTAGDRFAGVTKSQLKKDLGDWEIESFTPDEVILKKRVEGICDNHYYIGLRNGYVTLFRGIPGVRSEVVEKTEILAETLKEEDRTMLEKGIVINSIKEFQEIREGLTN